MYGIFAYIYRICYFEQPNVDKYTIHGWYGNGFLGKQKQRWEVVRFSGFLRLDQIAQLGDVVEVWIWRNKRVALRNPGGRFFHNGIAQKLQVGIYGMHGRCIYIYIIYI